MSGKILIVYWRRKVAKIESFKVVFATSQCSACRVLVDGFTFLTADEYGGRWSQQGSLTKPASWCLLYGQVYSGLDIGLWLASYYESRTMNAKRPRILLLRPDLLRSTVLLFITLAFALTLSACGNKGALFLEPDAETLRELEKAEREINEAANQATQPATGTPGVEIPKDKDKKKSQP